MSSITKKLNDQVTQAGYVITAVCNSEDVESIINKLSDTELYNFRLRLIKLLFFAASKEKKPKEKAMLNYLAFCTYFHFFVKNSNRSGQSGGAFPKKVARHGRIVTVNRVSDLEDGDTIIEDEIVRDATAGAIEGFSSAERAGQLLASAQQGQGAAYSREMQATDKKREKRQLRFMEDQSNKEELLREIEETNLRAELLKAKNKLAIQRGSLPAGASSRRFNAAFAAGAGAGVLIKVAQNLGKIGIDTAKQVVTDVGSAAAETMSNAAYDISEVHEAALQNPNYGKVAQGVGSFARATSATIGLAGKTLDLAGNVLEGVANVGSAGIDAIQATPAVAAAAAAAGASFVGEGIKAMTDFLSMAPAATPEAVAAAIEHVSTTAASTTATTATFTLAEEIIQDPTCWEAALGTGGACFEASLRFAHEAVQTVAVQGGLGIFCLVWACMAVGEARMVRHAQTLEEVPASSNGALNTAANCALGLVPGVGVARAASRAVNYFSEQPTSRGYGQIDNPDQQLEQRHRSRSHRSRSRSRSPSPSHRSRRSRRSRSPPISRSRSRSRSRSPPRSAAAIEGPLRRRSSRPQEGGKRIKKYGRKTNKRSNNKYGKKHGKKHSRKNKKY